MENQPQNPQNNEEQPQDEFTKLNELADKGELTPQSLQETLNKYAESLEQEFKATSSIDPANIPEYTRNFFKENVYTAAAQIVFLSNNADSESVRLRAAQTILQQAFADAEKDGDPIRELMQELAKNDGSPS